MYMCMHMHMHMHMCMCMHMSCIVCETIYLSIYLSVSCTRGGEP